MAQKFYLYTTDLSSAPVDNADGDNPHIPLAITADDGVMALYPDIVSTLVNNLGNVTAATAPTAYDTFDDLVTAHPTAVQNNRVSPRGLTLQIPGFGTSFMPILTDALQNNAGTVHGGDFMTTVNAKANDIDSNDPISVTEGDLSVKIIGYQGESRSFNAA